MGNQPAERKENKNHMEENKYRYADREEQLKKANSFLVLGFLVFYAFVMVVVVTACIRHIRTVGYTAMLSHYCNLNSCDSGNVSTKQEGQ